MQVLPFRLRFFAFGRGLIPAHNVSETGAISLPLSTFIKKGMKVVKGSAMAPTGDDEKATVLTLDAHAAAYSALTPTCSTAIGLLANRTWTQALRIHGSCECTAYLVRACSCRLKPVSSHCVIRALCQPVVEGIHLAILNGRQGLGLRAVGGNESSHVQQVAALDRVGVIKNDVNLWNRAAATAPVVRDTDLWTHTPDNNTTHHVLMTQRTTY